MLIFNSKLDNSISGTKENIDKAIIAIEKSNEIKGDLSDITQSNILQALLDTDDPGAQTAASVRAIIDAWREKKAPGKATWCAKRGLLYDSQLSQLATLIKDGAITYEEYSLILLSKIWISDGVNSAAVFTNALRVLSLVDNNADSFYVAFAKAYSKITGKSWTKDDFHSAELTQFSSIVQAAGFSVSRTGEAIKDVIAKWGCDFDTISNPKYGYGIFPDFHIDSQVYDYTGNTTNGIFEAEFGDPAEFNRKYPHISVKPLSNKYMQKIYYGAPGTGKSNEIKILTGEGKDGIKFKKNFTFRTTFHPDSDYSSFVGAYKPVWDESKDKIVYEFRPQTFLKAYVAAWTNPGEDVALVVEEINRGNCAQIFGDIFQLLDREATGLSKYPIEADIDMKSFISKAFSGEITEAWVGSFVDDEKESVNEYYSNHYDEAFEKIKSGDIMVLPKNLSILATMNTSDQSLFPMDSAFKRRWEWAYQPIVEGIDNTTGKSLDWKIMVDGYELIDWWDFLQRINRVVSDLTTSEDKQLGYFFCMPDKKKEPADLKPSIISAGQFVGKVIFYLWNDVFKDYAFDAVCCKDKDEKEVLFAKFYKPDGKSVNVDVLAHFFETLKSSAEDSFIKKIPDPASAPASIPAIGESGDGEDPGAHEGATE